MDTQYNERIAQYVSSKAAEQTLRFQVFVSQGNEIVNRLTKHDFSFLPCMVVYGGYDFCTTNIPQSENIDYTREMPATVSPSIVVLTDSVSEVVELEKTAVKMFSSPVSLEIVHPFDNDCLIPFHIALDNSKETERCSKTVNTSDGSCTIFETTIPLKSDANIVFMREYHPAEIKFDRIVQLALVQRGRALEELKASEHLTSVQKTQVCAALDKVISLLDLSDMEGYGFADLLRVMIEEKCDIEDAKEEAEDEAEEREEEREAKEQRAAEEQKKAAEQKKAEQERIEKANRIYASVGDVVLNHYTDAVVNEIKVRFADQLSATVYGGSTASEWDRIRWTKGFDGFSYPHITVNDRLKLTFECKTYTNIDAHGEPVTHNCSITAFPIQYSFALFIYTRSNSEADKIEALVKQTYGTETQILVPDLQNPEEQNVIKILVDESGIRRHTESQDDGEICGVLIPFAEYFMVYHPREVEKSELTDNHTLQCAMLQLAQYGESCRAKLHTALEKVNSDYKSLITPPTGFLSKTFRGALQSQEFKRLQQMFDQHQKIDKELFHTVLKEITSVYPLWDKMCAGWSLEQIAADISHYREEFYNYAHNIWANILELPERFNNYAPASDQAPSDYMIAYMQEDSERSLADALRAYQGYLEFRQAQRRAEEQRRLEEMRQRRLEREEAGGSQSGGFISGMLQTAGGVALGNKITDSRRKKEAAKAEKNTIKYSYTCSLTCPYRGKSYGPTKCRRDPATCGHGLRY